MLFLIERAMFCVVAPHVGLMPIIDCGQSKWNKIFVMQNSQTIFNLEQHELSAECSECHEATHEMRLCSNALRISCMNKFTFKIARVVFIQIL